MMPEALALPGSCRHRIRRPNRPAGPGGGRTRTGNRLRLLILTDLDGTLLDHETYDATPARPMLGRLAAAGHPVILASSKTRAEIAGIQAELGLTHWPAVVENGAALAEDGFDDRGWQRIRATLAELAAPFRGFGDMTVAEVARITGLPPEAAARAKRREHSEPGLWQGSAAGREAFIRALLDRGISARSGGRFLTLSLGGTKADRMADLRARFRPGLVIALGDAPNDAEMLMAADRAVIVRNDHGPGLPPLPGEAEGRILRSRAQGPAGWAEGLGRILADIGPQQGETDG